MCKQGLTKSLLVMGLLVVTAPVVQALQDPTQPSQYRAVAKRIDLNLESILFSETRRVAVINGKALQEGENLGGAKIVSIGKDTVRVQRQGKTIYLKLKQPIIRQDN